MSEYKLKYYKYKNKYLELKKQLGGNNDYNDYYMSNIDMSNIDISSNFYYKQNIYSYWISSSHNTYLPYNQYSDSNSVCYYRLQSMMYFGGCLEIDTVSISEDNNDIMITHLDTNPNQIRLSSVLQILFKTMDYKKNNNIITGPIILTYDNKKLKTKKEHDVFWSVIDRELLSKDINFVYKIDNGFDLTKTPLNVLNNKILLRWGQNEKCINEQNIDKDIGKELCPPPVELMKKISSNNEKWLHLNKGKYKFSKGILEETNLSVSISVGLTGDIKEPNKNVILNTQRNLLRMYPHFTSINSGNYNNMKFYRDGAQIVALNIQKMDTAWYLNSAMFLPNTGLPCSPKQVLDENVECRTSWKESIDGKQPLAFRLKPLWLLGLIPHPGYYNLSIMAIKVEKYNYKENMFEESSEYSNFEIFDGLYNNKSSKTNNLNSNNIINNVDVSIPFFIISFCKNCIIKNPYTSEYKTGVEIPWSIKQLEGEITVDLHKLQKTKLNKFNKVNISEHNDNDCMDSYLFNSRKRLRVQLRYRWIKSNKEMNSLNEYNNKITELRNNYNKPTIDFLNDINLFTRYQTDLCKANKSEEINDNIYNNGDLLENDQYPNNIQSETQINNDIDETLED